MLTNSESYSRKISFGDKRNKFLAVCLTTTLIICVILAIVVFLLAFKTTENNCSFGKSTEWIRAAGSLLTLMDPTVEPCDNFYEFVCGRWKRNHFSPTELKISWFSELGSLIDKIVQDYLNKEDSEDEPEAVHSARRFYRSCLDTEAMAEHGLTGLSKLLTKVGLPFLPFGSNASESKPWLEVAALTKRYTTRGALIDVDLYPLPQNRTSVKLILKPATDEQMASTSAKKLVAEPDPRVTVPELEKDAMVKFLRFFPNAVDEEVSDAKFEQAAYQILQVSNGLLNIKEQPDVKEDMMNIEFNEYKVEDYQTILDEAAPSGKSKLRLKPFLEQLFETIPGVKLDLEGQDTILVYNELYFIHLSEFLDGLTENQLELYLWHDTVYSLADHVGAYLAETKNEYVSTVLVGGPPPKTREELCRQTVTMFMKPAVSYFIVEDASITMKREMIMEMVYRLNYAFLKEIESLSWMDENTKARAVTKTEAIETFVAAMEDMEDKTKLNKALNIPLKEDTYFSNLMKVLDRNLKRHLKNLRSSFPTDMFTFDTLTINAFYNPLSNNIFVPAGVLQFPFYDMGLQSLNFGAIGSVLGHEMLHAVDYNKGKNYDWRGNRLDWWSEESGEEYLKRTKCFVDQFNEIYIPSLNATVNGELTLDENIADNGGLKLAYKAFKHHEKIHGRDPKVPGLHEYTSDQLFFWGFTHLWCSEYRTKEILQLHLQDEHTPDFARVVAILQNSPEFAKAWSCPPGSFMNPQHKCKLWVN